MVSKAPQKVFVSQTKKQSPLKLDWAYAESISRT